MPKHITPGLPSRQQILDFISGSDTPAGKREIARAFGLSGQEKITLKALLKDMADEGLIDSAPGRAFHKMGGVPKVTVLRIVDVEGDQAVAVPESWHAETPPPRLRVMERGKRSALGPGDRILARTEEAGRGWLAHPLKKLARGEDLVLGVLHKEGDRLWLKPVDKREKRDWAVSDAGEAGPGDLVLAEKTGRPPRLSVKVQEVLGDPFQPRSFSLIAIHKHGIPDQFPEEAIEEAEDVVGLPLGEREDLTHLSIVAIDPVDARDHDDAVWAMPDDDPANPGGFRAIVAIADVAFYVRPGGLLDREARKRGNSVYFPDRVVPMLPETLSADICSLKAGQDRAALACHLTISATGKLTAWRFTRAKVRLAANIPYEEAQAAIDAASSLSSSRRMLGSRDEESDGPLHENPDAHQADETGSRASFRWDSTLVETALQPLWACWRALAKARDDRAPLDLDLPERRVVLDERGRILSVAPRERLDAHRLIEDYMIAANVAAAKALEAKKAPVMYRVHEPPSREKLVALRDYLKTFGIDFALGQVVRPATFNHILGKLGPDDETRPRVMEQVLRSQTQAYYAPANAGHFGLALGSYAHFTSPIRRYADLVVHRALVGAYGLDPAAKATALTSADAEGMESLGQLISRAERRAMEAERETIDRYVAAYLATKLGDVLETRITGVQSFGFFATVEGFGGDGLVPVSTLGAERFHYDETMHTLTGEESGERYAIGQRLKLRLVEADPINGSLRFELPEGANHMAVRRPMRGKDRRIVGKRGRPPGIRHQGKR
ncbi:ribonuclease R family protein [Sphingomonas solaris]|uniref:Ribonuclease R n=1 Tax=Alterirhizorhabdus solaris TaxID=2529389 RepID=A0A558QVB1_9SPHN|nr:RNB domain-containing ribonuclease [Sphingomonas solaris]TVV71058.1 RNB domain-containing ribonuclease [Sphingomonas solaris]